MQLERRLQDDAVCRRLGDRRWPDLEIPRAHAIEQIERQHNPVQVINNIAATRPRHVRVSVEHALRHQRKREELTVATGRPRRISQRHGKIKENRVSTNSTTQVTNHAPGNPPGALSVRISGIVPVRALLAKFDRVSAVRFPIASGIVPVKPPVLGLKVISAVKLPMASGIVSVEALLLWCKVLKLPIASGIVSVKALLSKCKTAGTVKLPTASGIVLVRTLPFRNKLASASGLPKARFARNEANMCVTLGVTGIPIAGLNIAAGRHIRAGVVTLEVSYERIGRMKTEFDRNIQDMLVTLQSCPTPIGWLKAEIARNIQGELVTLEVCSPPIG